MKAIFKHALKEAPEQIVYVTVWHNLLGVGEENGAIFLYLEQDFDGRNPVEIKILAFATGAILPQGKNIRYIGHARINSATLHYYKEE